MHVKDILNLTFSLQDIMDKVKVEPESDDETQPVASENEEELPNTKQDNGLATFTFVSVKQESVSMVIVYTHFSLPVW